MENIESTPEALKKNSTNKNLTKYNYLNECLNKEFKNTFKTEITLIKPKFKLKLHNNKS